MTSEIQKREPSAVNIFEPTSMTEAMSLAKYVANSQLIPQTFQRKEADVLVAMIWSKELGVSFMQGIQNIAVINGKPSIYGDLQMALLWQSGLVDEYTETYDGEGDKRKAVITSSRKGVKGSVTKSYSMKEAQVAGLAGKDVWKKYTDDMLMWRARGRILDALYADVSKGLTMAEEARDYPAPKGQPANATPTEQPRRTSDFDRPEQGEDPPAEKLNKQEPAKKPAEITPMEHPEPTENPNTAKARKTVAKALEEDKQSEPDTSEAEVVDAECSDTPDQGGDEAPKETQATEAGTEDSTGSEAGSEEADDSTPSGQLKKAVVNKRRYGWSVKKIEERYGKPWNELSAFELKEVADAMRECKTDKDAVEKFLSDPLESTGEEATAPPAEASTGADANHDTSVNSDSSEFGKEMTLSEIDSLLEVLRGKGISPEDELGMPHNWDEIKNNQSIEDLKALRDDLKDFVG